MSIAVDESKIMSCIKGSPYGVKSVFVKIDSEWAIKLFKNSWDRDEIYENQLDASQYGLGPKVGEKVNFSVNCEYPYGYITEIVEVLVPHEEVANNKCTMFDYYDRSYDFHAKANELKDKLQLQTGIYYSDLHPANIGIKNGEYILIDFGTSDGYDCDMDEEASGYNLDSSNSNDNRLD